MEKKIRDFTDNELLLELKRREDIRNSTWPKEYKTKVCIEVDDDDKLKDFLQDQCGFQEESDEFDDVSGKLLDIPVNLKVDSNGTVEVSICNNK